MKIVLSYLLTTLIYSCRSWEYCQRSVQSELCGNQAHFACDAENSLSNSYYISKTFLAHVPLTRKVKTAFLKWHNYYRNRTAGGWARNNKEYFPKAVRMRELIWDSELSYLSHVRTKLVSAGDVNCRRTMRFPYMEENLIVNTLNDLKPVLQIIGLSLKQMFDEKNLILEAIEMPKSTTNRNKFTTMINDNVSRLGCSVALGADCVDEMGNVYKFCYYTACMYDHVDEGIIYKVGRPAGRCSFWKVGRSKIYKNLCANSGKA